MKRKIGLTVLLLGLYLILSSGWELIIVSSYADKYEYVEGYKQEFLAKNPNQVFDNNACLLKVENDLLKTTHKHSAIVIGGSILLILGVGLLLKDLLTRIKEKLFFVDIIEFLTGVIYILVIGLVFFIARLPLYNLQVTECSMSMLFIFGMASIVGFFGSYYCLTNRYFANKKYFKWLLGIIITMLTGLFLSYFISFPSALKVENFLKVELFLIPFILLTLIIFVNIITGMIFKGFFNWIRLLYKK